MDTTANTENHSSKNFKLEDKINYLTYSVRQVQREFNGKTIDGVSQVFNLA